LYCNQTNKTMTKEKLNKELETHLQFMQDHIDLYKHNCIGEQELISLLLREVKDMTEYIEKFNNK